MVRKLAGLTTMILLALLLAACGSDDDKDTATETATTVAGSATEAATQDAVETSPTTAAPTEAPAESSPVASPVTSTVATPAPESSAAPAGTPVASPVAASPAAIVPVAPADTAAQDEASPAMTEEVSLTGRVVLPGTANEAWVMTSEGCAGLGANTNLKPGQQLVVRDAEGAIIGVTMLAASDETDACSWDFSVTVPASPYYAVSVPMVVERVFTQQDVDASDGELIVPAA